jgi:hypothetical protein
MSTALSLTAIGLASAVAVALVGTWTGNSLAPRRGEARRWENQLAEVALPAALGLVGLLLAAAALADGDRDLVER